MAIQAKLNMLLGAEEFDRLFLGIECGGFIDGVFHLYVQNEYFAGQIDVLYCAEIIYAAQTVLGRHIERVNVLPKDFSSVGPATVSLSKMRKRHQTIPYGSLKP